MQFEDDERTVLLVYDSMKSDQDARIERQVPRPVIFPFDPGWHPVPQFPFRNTVSDGKPNGATSFSSDLGA